MQFLVLRFDESTKREVGINGDGTTSAPNQAELFPTRQAALTVAKKFGGQIQPESRVFADDYACGE